MLFINFTISRACEYLINNKNISRLFINCNRFSYFILVLQNNSLQFSLNRINCLKHKLCLCWAKFVLTN